MMNHQGSENIHMNLVERRKELLERFNDAVIEQPLATNWGGELKDADDAASLGILQLMEELLEVDAAIERIRDGDYGLCRRCRHVIALRRLSTYPETQFCARCESELAGEREQGQ